MLPTHNELPVVLFLCTGNSARSQMAEAFLRQLAGDRFQAHSAGLEPRGIHPLTRRVMQEVGLDLAGQTSKSLTEYLGKVAAKYVIFVCEHAEQSCPRVWPFALQTFCWPFPDPAAPEIPESEQLETFREVRDDIAARIKMWLTEQARLQQQKEETYL